MLHDLNLSVMLVEDDYHSRDILSVFLGELGISEVYQMTNGKEALSFFQDNEAWFGIVLCDWNMPEMSGAAFYRELRKLKPLQPFIMISGRCDEDSILFAKDNGISAYLLKPVELEELAKKIHKVVAMNAHLFKSAALESAPN